MLLQVTSTSLVLPGHFWKHATNKLNNNCLYYLVTSVICNKYISTVVAHPCVRCFTYCPYFNDYYRSKLNANYAKCTTINQKAIQATTEHHLCEDSDSRNVANV